MRYFLLILALGVVTVMGVFGKRGHHFKQPPLEIFPDMDRQAKLRTQQPNLHFTTSRTASWPPAQPNPPSANSLSSQEPVPGTVARGDHYESNAVNTGYEPG